jgi:hypothetical protein
MSEELKNQQPTQDNRPEYEPPRVLRLKDIHAGANGQCADGSGA